MAKSITIFAFVKIICCFSFILLVLLSDVAFCQSWPGYETGRFSGISSANSRPGGMAHTPFKADATLLGIHVFTQTQNILANNDAVGMISSGGFKGLSGFSKLTSGKTYVYSNVQGPSLLYSVNPKLSLAFSWNMRFLWSSRLTAPKLAQLFDSDISSLNINESNETASIVFNSWNEFGIGAGGEVFKKDHHSLSVGGLAKLVYGTGNVNFQLDNIEIETTDSTVEHLGFNMRALISNQAYDLVDGTINLFDRLGYGFDIGAEYQLGKTDSASGIGNYRLKAGFSLTDIGKTKYSSALQYTNISVSADNISLARFRDAPTLRAAIDTLQEIFDIDTSGTPSNYNVTLPMSLRLYGDYNFGNRLYIYTEFQFMFAKLMLPDADMPVIFRYNITPRFEDHRFGVYLPMTFTNNIPASVGIALRWKPFIIGSGNIFTFWAYEEYGKPLDFYLTIKIPILTKDQRMEHSKKKNK